MRSTQNRRTAERFVAQTIMLVALTGCASQPTSDDSHRSFVRLFDSARDRHVPVVLEMPATASHCSAAHPCPVALISAGYGIDVSRYGFVSTALSERGYLAVSVQHELPSDPPLPTQGDLFAARTPNWQRGAGNLRFVRDALALSHPAYDWAKPVLVGHSNGGDISAWLVRESPGFASILITLDHRRVPLPRDKVPRVLSLRASDFQADAGVLPTGEELARSNACVLKIPGARHNDMHDGGPVALKRAIVDHMADFLAGTDCETLRSRVATPNVKTVP